MLDLFSLYDMIVFDMHMFTLLNTLFVCIGNVCSIINMGRCGPKDDIFEWNE